MKYCVYFLLNPLSNNKPFYVGISKKPDRRYMEHCCDDDEKSSRIKKGIISKIHKNGKKVGMSIVRSNLTLQQACKIEIEYIAKFGRISNGTGFLSNMTDGGEGGKTSTSFKKGHKASKETNMKVSKALKGRVSPNKGNKFSQESRDKISKVHKGRKQSKDWIKKRTKNRCKKIIQLSLSNELVAEFDSLKEAANSVNSKSPSHISSVCLGKKNKAYGYKWKYV